MRERAHGLAHPRRAGGPALAALLLSMVMGACTKPNPSYCDLDAGIACAVAGEVCMVNLCVAGDAATPLDLVAEVGGVHVNGLPPDAGDAHPADGLDGSDSHAPAPDGPADVIAVDRPVDAVVEAPIEARPAPCTPASCLAAAGSGLPFCDVDAGTCSRSCAVAPAGTCASILDGGMPLCSLDSGRCTGCLADTDCKTGNRLFCVNGACASCAAAPSGACLAKDSAHPVCDMSGTCVECGADSDCKTGNKLFCVAGICSNCNARAGACLATNPTHPVCDTAGTCVECATNGQCTAGNKLFCVNEACATCATAATTACRMKDAAHPVCDTGGACVECTASSQCTTANKLFCVSEACSTCTAAAGLCTGALPVCDPTSQTCVECDVDGDCKTAAKPSCTASHVCGPCRTDVQCAAKLGTATPNPGVCMSHQDGRCATDAETIYVNQSGTAPCIANPVVTDGTAVRPLCNPGQALGLFTAARRLVVIRGAVGGFSWTFTGSPAEVSVVGQNNESNALPVVVGGLAPGIQLSHAPIYMRGLQVRQSIMAGIIVENGSMLRMDSVLVQGNTEGGLRLRASGFNIQNSIFAGNGGGLDPVVGLFGGVFISAALAPAGAPHHFAFNTVADNAQVGLVAMTQTNVWASLLANNTPNDVAGMVNVQFSKTSGDPNLMLDPTTFHIGTGSSCRDFVVGPALTAAMTAAGDVAALPALDIDAQTRPQGPSYDCGADELLTSPGP